MSVYENVVNKTEVYDFEDAQFLRDFALHHNYQFTIKVGRHAYVDFMGEERTRRCYDVEICCPRDHFNKIMEEV